MRSRACLPGALFIAGALAACSTGGDVGVTFLADPGKYQFYDCEQLARDLTGLTKRRQDLKALIDRAGQTAAGTAVGAIAYRTDYASVNEDIGLLNAAARAKGCQQNEAWRSNSAIQ
jgi:hypothetical protein